MGDEGQNEAGHDGGEVLYTLYFIRGMMEEKYRSEEEGLAEQGMKGAEEDNQRGLLGTGACRCKGETRGIPLVCERCFILYTLYFILCTLVCERCLL